MLKRTALKLEVQQNFWQCLHKSLVYPLKCDSVVKVKFILKKTLFLHFLNDSILKIGNNIHFCHLSVFSLLVLGNRFWSILVYGKRNQRRCTLSCNRRFSTVLSVEGVNLTDILSFAPTFGMGYSLSKRCICSQCYCFAQDSGFSP